MHPWTPEGRTFLMGPLSRNSTCLMEMEKDEKQTGFMEKGEEGKYLMELHYLRSVF